MNLICKNILQNNISNRGLRVDFPKWNFDLRPLLLDYKIRRQISILFWNHYEKKFPFQIIGIEFSGIPISLAIQEEGIKRGYNCNILIFRKNKKSQTNKTLIEGWITNDKIIFIDDILNSGKSFNIVNKELKKKNKVIKYGFFVIDFQRKDCNIHTNYYNIFSLQDFNLPKFKFVD